MTFLAQTASAMSWWQALILGIVEGITEYLPISSTGHLLLTQRLMGIPQNDASDAFAITIQGGAIVAVLLIYWKRVEGMLLGVIGKNREGLLLARNIIIAFLPAVVLGLLLNKKIKELLFHPWPITTAVFVGGVAILAVAWFRRNAQPGTRAPGLSLTQLTPLMALFIGAMQCVAMWPGTSRSLMTIVAGLLAGLSMAAAVEFAFLLGLLTLSAATFKDGYEHGALMLKTYGPGSIAIGFIAAWISAMIAVKWMVTYLQSRGLSVFGWYRIGLAVLMAALLLTGTLPA